ncbi:MAG: DNA polymerase III subunit beta [Oscillospiraceae bacterium]|nr:DNA polymerase III subunit beta [Oscillospiraceae bacterium]
MKFTVDRQQMTEACQNAARAVSSKSTVPALEGLLLTAENNQLKINGYDLEMGIITNIPANVQEEGSIVLNSRLFCDILRRLPVENVYMEADAKQMTTIRAGDAEFSIMGLDAAEFPLLPAVEDRDSFAVNTETLSGMIRQTLFAVAQTDIKPVLTGILFELSGGILQMVALDGYRLAIRREPVSSDLNVKFIVPGKTVSEIAKLLAQGNENAELIIGDRHITFKIGEYYVVSRLLEGSFIDYKTALPKEITAEIFVPARALINCVELISLIITDRLKSPVRCAFDGTEIKVSCTTTTGRANDKISCTGTEIPEVEMGFNNKYLLDALKACEDEEIKIQLSGPLSPMKLVPVEGDAFLFLVLPVRLKNEV